MGLGVWRLTRRALEWTNIALAIGFAFFAMAFLAWAAAGSQFSLVGMLRSTVILSVVVVFGALTGLMCERVGVINIGIEGQLLASAFAGVVLSSAFGTWAGLAGALLTGGLLGLLLAWLTIKFHVDQIIAGVVINFLALGLTSLMSSRILTDVQSLNAETSPIDTHTVSGRHPGHRKHVLRPHILRVWHVHPRHCNPPRLVLRDGASARARSESIRWPLTRLASTSTGCVIGTWPWAE